VRALIGIALACAACGDDGAAPPDASEQDLMDVPAGCVVERSTGNRPDDSTRDQIRFLYVLPSDGVDAGHDTSGKICNSVRGVATWFHEQTGQFLRIDTQDGLIDIGFVRLSKTDAEMRGTDANNNTIENGVAFVRERIERGSQAMGLVAPNRLYGVFYDGTSSWACGGGAYPPLISDRVGAMYLQAIPLGQTQACGASYPWGQASLVPNYVDYGILHELVHSMGIVSMTSPHQHSTGHVYDLGAPNPNSDLMYSPRMGMPDPGWATNTGLVIDIGSDDYYNAGAADLATMSLLAPLPENARRPTGW